MICLFQCGRLAESFNGYREIAVIRGQISAPDSCQLVILVIPSFLCYLVQCGIKVYIGTPFSIAVPRVAEVARRRKGPLPESLDTDKNYKP